MIIAQISDTHIQTALPGAAMRLEALERTVRSINALSERPVAVLHTGDVAHDATDEDYAAAAAVLRRLEAPVFAIMGNRDRRPAFRRAFGGDGYLDARSPFIQYGVEIGGLRMVALDTYDEESGLGHICDEREREYAALIEQGRGRPTLVFLHHAPVPMPDLSVNPLQWRDHGRAALLVERLANAPDVVGVVAGHVHRAQTVCLVGKAGPAAAKRTLLTTIPSIAPDLRREKLIPKSDLRPIYHLHRIDDGDMTTASVQVPLEA